MTAFFNKCANMRASLSFSKSWHVIVSKKCFNEATPVGAMPVEAMPVAEFRIYGRSQKNDSGQWNS